MSKKHKQLDLHVRYAVVLVGSILLFLRWKTYLSMRTKPGLPFNEVQSQITSIGKDDFNEDILVNKGMKKSFLNWFVRNTA